MIHPTAPSLRRAYASWAHGQIHYYDAGGDGVPLLMLHQSPASSSDWFALLPFLAAAGVRVIAMDNPGMGMSDPVAYEPTVDDLVEAVPVVLDDAGVPVADLVGHHTGVQLAVEAAVRYPNRIRSLSLYGVPVLSEAEREHYWQLIVRNEMDGAVHRALPGGTNLTDHFRRLEGYFQSSTAQRMVLAALMSGPLWWHGHNAALRHDVVPALLAATQPILLLTNAEEMFDANTREAARLRPDATLVDLNVASAMAMDDAPEAMVQAIVKFRESIDQG